VVRSQQKVQINRFPRITCTDERDPHVKAFQPEILQSRPPILIHNMAYLIIIVPFFIMSDLLWGVSVLVSSLNRGRPASRRCRVEQHLPESVRTMPLLWDSDVLMEVNESRSKTRPQNCSRIAHSKRDRIRTENRPHQPPSATPESYNDSMIRTDSWMCY